MFLVSKKAKQLKQSKKGTVQTGATKTRKKASAETPTAETDCNEDEKRSADKVQKQANELRGKVLDVLKKLLEQGKNAEILELVQKLVARNEELERLLAKLRSKKNRSERLSNEQLHASLDKLRGQSDELLKQATLQLEQKVKEHGEKTQPPPAPPKQPPRRRPAPPELRRVPNPILVPEQERDCPVCGTERKTVGFETQEVVELIPAEVIVRLDQREILACELCEGEMQRAPMGDKVVTGGSYGSRLVGSMVFDKYWQGMPLNRIGQELQMLGLTMPSSTMSDQIMWAADLLQPIHEQLQDMVLGSTIMHMDSTPLPVRDKDTKFQILLGSLWGYVGVSGDEKCAVYLYTSTGKKVGQRPGELGPEQFLSERSGPTVCDAGSVFLSSLQTGKMIEVGCNMHARRYFVRAMQAGDERASAPLAAFQGLYNVEDSVKDASDEQRLSARQTRSKPIYEQLLQWALVHKDIEPPASLLGIAVNYLWKHREALTRFLSDARLPIDNGEVERLHRRPGMGRNSYLFAGSHEGGRRAAIAYSVIASCVMAGVNPIEYLAEVLPEVARAGPMTREQFARLVPLEWKKRQFRPPEG